MDEVAKKLAEQGVDHVLPVAYKDGLQPAMRQAGQGLELVGRSVNLLLAPLYGLVWTGEQIRDWISREVAKRLVGVPEEQLQTPSPQVAGPAIEAMRFSGSEPTLSDMYANLLASAMVAGTTDNAHPAFVEIIRQLKADEALLLKFVAHSKSRYFPLVDVNSKAKEGGGFTTYLSNFNILVYLAECKRPQRHGEYIDNLCRLGITQIPAAIGYSKCQPETIYDTLLQQSQLQSAAKTIAATGREPQFIKKTLAITDFGQAFIRTCVLDFEVNSDPVEDSEP